MKLFKRTKSIAALVLAVALIFISTLPAFNYGISTCKVDPEPEQTDLDDDWYCDDFF